MTIETPQTTAAGDDQQPATEQQPATAQPAAQPAAIAGDTPAGGTPAATLAELEAACPGADPAFILGQLKTGATTAAATRAFISAQQETITRLQQQPAVGTVTQPEPAAAVRRDLSSAGVDPLVTTGNNNPANDRSPVDQMRAYVRDKVAAGVPADKAMRMFHKENPELRQMAIEAANT